MDASDVNERSPRQGERPPSPLTRLSRAFEPVGRLEAGLWLAVLVALTGDLVLTYYGLRLGLSEGNPLVHVAFDEAGFAVLGLLKVVVLGTAGFARETYPRYAIVIPLGLAVPWLAAVVVNGYLIATVLPA